MRFSLHWRRKRSGGRPRLWQLFQPQPPGPDGQDAAPMWSFVLFFVDACSLAVLVFACCAVCPFFWSPWPGFPQETCARRAKLKEEEKSIESRSQNVRTGTAVAQMRSDAIPARHPAQGLCLSHHLVPKSAHALVGAMLASPACLAGQGCSAAFVPARPFRGCWRCLRKEDGRGPGRTPGLQTLLPGFWQKEQAHAPHNCRSARAQGKP